MCLRSLLSTPCNVYKFRYFPCSRGCLLSHISCVFVFGLNLNKLTDQYCAVRSYEMLIFDGDFWCFFSYCSKELLEFVRWRLAQHNQHIISYTRHYLRTTKNGTHIQTHTQYISHANIMLNTNIIIVIVIQQPKCTEHILI